MISVTLIPIIPNNQNYAYVLEAENGEVAVVDPGEAAPIISFLESKNIKPDVILITHHHWDHMDGAADMLAWHACPLIGSDPHKSSEHSPAKTKLRLPFARILNEEDDFEFGGERVEILDTPGHTPEHICFHFPESGFLLAGDIIFSMGCGRILDGRPEELFSSLQKIYALPDNTKIYCGHEYTLSNAEFCLNLDPENVALQKRLEDVKELSANDTPTIPTSLEMEKQTNLFLRAKTPEEFKKLRSLKDRA